jgi:predicted transcriptional regulator
MSVMSTDDKEKVVSVAEDGTPVTGTMIDRWCAAYEAGELPDGYEVEGIARRGRPPLHGERMSSMTIRLPQAQKVALEEAASVRGIPTSVYVRSLLVSRTA